MIINFIISTLTLGEAVCPSIVHILEDLGGLSLQLGKCLLLLLDFLSDTAVFVFHRVLFEQVLHLVVDHLLLLLQLTLEL